MALTQARLFALLRPHYERRDQLQLIIDYRRRYLDLLLIEGEEVADTVVPDYQQARAETGREYEDAAAEAAEHKELSDAQAREFTALFRKLVRLYHPDRFANDPQQYAIHERLTREISQARDRGDIQRLREIATDPNGFLAQHGGGFLDFGDETDLMKLRQLHESLQARILETLEALGQLRESSEYELCRLSRDRSDFLESVAEQQANEIRSQITTLEEEARTLADEIESLTGMPDHFAD